MMAALNQRDFVAGSDAFAFPARTLAPVFDAVQRTGDVCSKVYLAWQREMLDFTNTRLQQDAEFGSNLMHCRKLSDAAALQQRWVADTMTDYVKEAGRLMELAANLTDDVTRTSREQVSEVVEGVRQVRRASARAAARRLAMGADRTFGAARGPRKRRKNGARAR